MSFMENVAEIYGESLVIPVCPSVTRWTAHDRACKSLYDGYKQFLNALGVCVNERKESETVGIFSEITDCEFIATILTLRDVFDAVQPLNLVLQKGDGSLCLADIPVYLHKTLKGLEKLESPENRKWCQEEKFNELKEMADEETLNMPPSSKLRSSNQFNFAFFIQNTYLLLTGSLKRFKRHSSSSIFGSASLFLTQECFQITKKILLNTAKMN